MAITDSIKDSDCFTAKELADDLDISVPRLRQILPKAKKSGKVPWLVKTKGTALLYTPQFVEALKAWRVKGGAGKTRDGKGGKVRSISGAVFAITVPVFDKQIADMLNARFKTEEDMSKFLQAKLEETVKPKLNKLLELEKQYEKDRQSLLYNND